MAAVDHGECHQGLFVATTEGELLGTRHTRDPEQLLEMLGSALENWDHRSTQKETTEVENIQRDARFAWVYPEDGLVLHQGFVDLPRPNDARPQDWRSNAHNQDYVWITREEKLSLIPDNVAPGDSFPLYGPVARRLVRFHLLDMVRGETSPWTPEAVREADIQLAATHVSPQQVDLRLSGHVDLCEYGEWCAQPPSYAPHKRGQMCCMMNERGYEANLLGHLSFNRITGEFTRFNVVVSGIRWGGTTFNARPDDTDPAPMGLAFTIAGTEARDRTPPHAGLRAYFEA